MGFGSLRLINEDRVEPTLGFSQHPHSEMEIFTYIVSGELEHKDSMGNLEIMKRGDIQVCLTTIYIAAHISRVSDVKVLITMLDDFCWDWDSTFRI